MELKEWLDLLVVPGIFIGGFYWLHQQIKAEVKTVRDEARAAHDNIGKNIGQVREDLGKSIGQVREDLGKNIGQVREDLGKNIGQVREDLKRMESRVDELAKETRALHRAVGQLEGTVDRVARRDP